MKKLTMILLFLSFNAWGGEYNMKCEKVKENTGGYIKRCVNKETICYAHIFGNSGGLSCFKK